MSIYLSLLLLVASGVGFTVMPEWFFGIPKETATGALLLWVGSLKLFVVPLCLLVLAVAKNFFVTIATLVWGGWMVVVTFLFFLKIQEYAPTITHYGSLFLSTVFILSLSIFIFSAVRFVPDRFKLSKSEDPPVNPS